MSFIICTYLNQLCCLDKNVTFLQNKEVLFKSPRDAFTCSGALYFVVQWELRLWCLDPDSASICSGFRQYHHFIWTCQCCLRHVCKRVFTTVYGVQKFLCHFILSGVLRELNHEHTRFHPYVTCIWWTWNGKCDVLYIVLLFKPREKTQKSTTCNYGYGTIFLESCEKVTPMKSGISWIYGLTVES